jgi:3',5'-cyclic-nucleotide phosphodiesterase
MKRWIVCLIAVLISTASLAADAAKPAFTAIALGVAGGLSENNLSSFLLAPAGTSEYVSLDAGSVISGIKKGLEKGSFKEVALPADLPIAPEWSILQNNIKAYLISHPHLDHISGLVINSPDDAAKVIMGLEPTLKAMQDNIFNEKTWPNFGDKGPGFNIKKYTYVQVKIGEETPIKGSTMTVKSFPLSHGPGMTSTAFLVKSGDQMALYLGDTGPDEVEKKDLLKKLWAEIAPLIKAKTLRGMFIEVSFPNDKPDNQLFGHLTPKWLLHELKQLATQIDPTGKEKPLQGLKVLITHIKPSMQKGVSPEDIIKKELAAGNDLGVQFEFPKQGDRLDL